MSIDPRISLAVRAPNVAPAINIFENALMNAQTRDIREQQAQQQAQLAPLVKQQTQQRIDINQQALDQSREQQRLRSIARAGVELKPFLEQALQTGDTSKAQEFLTKRFQDLSQRQLSGEQVDTRETVDAITALRQGDIQGLLNQVNSAIEIGGVLPRAPAETASQRDFDTFQGLLSKAKQTGAPEDLEKANQFGRQSGFIRPTEQEKADISVDTAGRKKAAEGISKRKQGFIDSGVEAADSVANIKRSIELLDTVKTGGFANAAFRVKQFFGVEGADEGELSANLGTAILAQLKPIFGAAFTAAEGERLERISARFGVNPDTNKRLLGEMLRIAERAANRGLRAAEESGDDFTVEEIKNALTFKREDTEENAQPQVLRFDAQGNPIQ